MGHREIISTPEVRQVGMMGVRKKLLTRSLKPQTSNRGFRDKRSVTHCSCSTFYFKKIIEQDKLSCTGKKLCVSMLINQMVLLDLFCRTIPPPQYRHRMSWVIYHCLHKNCAQHIHHSQVACVQQRGLQDLWHQACCLWRQCYVHSFLSFLGNLMFFCRVYCFTNFRSKSKSQNTQKVMTNKNFEKKACEFFLLFFFFSLLISFSYCSQVDTSWFPLRQKKKPSSLWSSPVNIQRA